MYLPSFSRGKPDAAVYSDVAAARGTTCSLAPRRSAPRRGRLFYSERIVSRTVRLVAQARRFVASEEGLGQVGQERTLVIPVGVWNRAIGLAESQGFRSRGRHFHPAEAATFAAAVKQALDIKPVVVASRRLSAITPAEQLREFFDDPSNRKMLLRIVALAEMGGGLDVTDG
jgi:hypothetical protein